MLKYLLIINSVAYLYAFYVLIAERKRYDNEEYELQEEVDFEFKNEFKSNNPNNDVKDEVQKSVQQEWLNEKKLVGHISKDDNFYGDTQQVYLKKNYMRIEIFCGDELVAVSGNEREAIETIRNIYSHSVTFKWYLPEEEQ